MDQYKSFMSHARAQFNPPERSRTATVALCEVQQNFRSARFTAPVLMATERYTRENLSIADVKIPKGELVLAALGSANHDETQFEHPESLVLDRQNNKHLGFGQGACGEV
jgi:hypothetical protein